MNAIAKRATTLNIAQGACSIWRATHGGWLRACMGHAWVTVEGDPEDYWLAPGDALPFAPGERVRVGRWREAVSCEWCPLDGGAFAVAQRFAARVLFRVPRLRVKPVRRAGVWRCL